MTNTDVSDSRGSVFRLCYASRVNAPLTEAEFASIGISGRHNNARLNITGMLLHSGGYFMQVLEGDEEHVRGLYQMIAGDPRHADLVVVGAEYAQSRRFPRMPMSCADVAREDLPENTILEQHIGPIGLGPNAFRQIDDLIAEFYGENFTECGSARTEAFVAA